MDAHDDCCRTTVSSVSQTLNELEFERGIWGAALDGDVNKVKKLLDKGKNPSVCDSSGYTALHYAARSGHKAVCELLLKNGANSNAQTPGGATPLQRAAFKGHEDIALILLKYNADPSLCDSDKKTALHKAAEGQHLNVAEILVNLRPTLKEQQDIKGFTAKEYVKKENTRLLNLLQ